MPKLKFVITVDDKIVRILETQIDLESRRGTQDVWTFLDKARVMLNNTSAFDLIPKLGKKNV